MTLSSGEAKARSKGSELPSSPTIPLAEDGSPQTLSPAIIRWIFRMRGTLTADGKRPTYVQIANALEVNNVPTPGHAFGRKGRWTGNKVYELIKNPTRKGSRKVRIPVFAWERRPGFDYGGGGTIEVDLQDEAWRIVTDDEWANAQAEPRDPTSTRKPAAPYVLSGKVHCYNCGQPMRVSKPDFVCDSYPRQDECRKARYSIAALEKLALGLIEEAIGVEAETAFQKEQMVRAKADFAARMLARRQLEEQIESLRGQSRANRRLARDYEGTPLGRALLMEAAEWAEVIEQGEKELSEPIPPDPEEIFPASATSAQAAMANLTLRAPNGVIRPSDAEGVQCLQVLAEAIDRVDVLPSQHGRFDITIRMSGKPWGMKDGGPIASFPGRIVTAVLIRENEMLQEVTEGLASGRFRPTEDLLADLDLPEAALRFPQKVDKVLEALTMALMLRITPSDAASHMNAGHTFRFKLTRYWHTEECRVLIAKLAGLHGMEVDQKKVRVGPSVKRTLAQELREMEHPIFQYAPADASSGETALSDGDWNYLLNAGLAFPNGALKGGKSRGDRKHLNALLYIIRNDCAFTDLPAHMGSVPAVRTFKHALIRSGATDALIRALLASRGIDLAANAVIPPLASSQLEAINEKMRRTFASRASAKRGARRSAAKRLMVSE